MSQQINLFNPIFLKQKKYFSAVTMAQALALVLAGSLLVAGYARYQLGELDKEAASVAATANSVRTQLAKVNADLAPRQKSKALEQEMEKTEAQLKSLEQVFDILKRGEFGNTQGYSEYMRAFARQIGGGLWLTGFNIVGAGNEIGLQGRTLRADAVPAYLGRLKNEPALQGKSFSALEMQTSQSAAGDKQGNAPAAAQEQPATPTYIEFSLRSSGMPDAGSDTAGTLGAKGK
jgi:Tfp pilus assembly protein PilN